jgi:hypothetical protein
MVRRRGRVGEPWGRMGRIMGLQRCRITETWRDRDRNFLLHSSQRCVTVSCEREGGCCETLTDELEYLGTVFRYSEFL